MAKNPDDRYSSMGDMLNELRAIPAASGTGDWATGAELWAVPSYPTIATNRYAETQRLSVAMQNASSSHRGQRSVPLIASCLALVIGAVWAWTTRPVDPLAVGAGEVVPQVAKRENAAAQYRHAVAVDEDSAIRAV